MKKDALVFIKHIRDAIGEVGEFLSGVTEENFLNDAKTQKAVVRDLEIMGESVKNLSMEFRARYPQVDWEGVAGFRDVVVHDYFELDWKIVWEVVEKNLPVLKAQISKILADAG